MKATENEDMKRLINSRLWYTVNTKVGVQPLAKQSNISPQTFYNIRDNSRMPHTDTVLAIKKAVPELNMEILYSPDESLPMESLFDKAAPAGSGVRKDGVDWEAKYHDLESKVNGIVDTMTQKYNDLMDKFSLLENQKNFMEKVLRRVDPTLFSESDSQFTAIPMTRRLISMGRHDSPVTECKVIQHPATAQLASVRVLDSRVVRIGA